MAQLRPLAPAPSPTLGLALRELAKALARAAAEQDVKP